MTFHIPGRCFALALVTTFVFRAPAFAAEKAIPTPTPRTTSKATPDVAPEVAATFFTGDTLPTPPQQYAPWKAAATAFDNKFVEATSKLFEQGLADPRGCEYREIEIAVSRLWNGNNIIQTRGWVLPRDRNNTSSTRFAVAWNGLVYPLLSIGKAADVKTDVAAMIQSDLQAQKRQLEANRATNFSRFRFPATERTSLDLEMLLPVKACLLLRLGETDQARKVWEAYKIGLTTIQERTQFFEYDAYLMLATDWVWARFARMLEARQRGDDRLSLIDARVLGALHLAVESEAARHNYSGKAMMRETYSTGYGATEKTVARLYLSFLQDLPLYLADQQRRVKESALSKLDFAWSAKATTTQLIASLDQITEEVYFGSYDVTGIKNALINKGDEVVEPLIRVLESDKRLTRGASENSFTHGFLSEEYQRTPTFVAEIALQALSRILQTPTSYRWDLRNETQRTEIITRLRQQWNEIKSASREERWYLILDNDTATRDQWLQAAANIVDAVTTKPPRITNGGFYKSAYDISAFKARDEKLQGEVLRTKQKPSVTELMLRRIESFKRDLPTIPNQGTSYDVSGSITQMALLLSRWDAKAALPILQEQSIGAPRDSRSRLHDMTIARVQAGDDTAFDEYSMWLLDGLQRNNIRLDFDLSPREKSAFAPLWLFSDKPAMQQLAQQLLNNANSPVKTAFERSSASWFYDLQKMIASRLVEVPLFKARVLRELGDKTVIGTVTVSATDQWNSASESLKIETLSGVRTFDSIYENKTNPLKIGDKTDLRVCDFFAWQLRSGHGDTLQGANFKLAIPTNERDAAIRKTIALLRVESKNT